jgi:hypothetical protein
MIARLTAALLCITSVVGTVSDCGVGKSLFTITELSQDPATNVIAGQNVSLTLKYTAPEEIPSGTATTSVTLNFIPFTPTVEDLCTKAACPITVGEHDGSSWGLFPSGVSGSLVSKVEWKDASDRLLLCIQSKLAASSESQALVLYTNRTVENDYRDGLLLSANSTEEFSVCPANHTSTPETKRNLRSKKI